MSDMRFGWENLYYKIFRKSIKEGENLIIKDIITEN